MDVDVRSIALPELTRFAGLLPAIPGVVFPPEGRPFLRAEPGVEDSPAVRRIRCLVDILAVRFSYEEGRRMRLW